MQQNKNLNEEMLTKQCPYCGEEILETAKKCKHCREWLESVTTMEAPKNTDEAPKNTDINYTLLMRLCYAAMLFVVISAVQSIIQTFLGDTEIRVYNKGTLWLWIAKTIPEWVVTICEGFLMVYLIMALRKQYILMVKDKPIPFVALVILTTVGYLCSLIVSFEFDLGLIGIIFIPILIGESVLEFIVGFQLRQRLKEASLIGTAMIIYAIVPIVALIVEFGMGNEELVWTAIVGGVASLFFLYTLNRFFNKKDEENDIVFEEQAE